MCSADLTYKNDIIDDVVNDMFKAAKILGNIDHNLAFVDVGNSTGIIRNIEQLILYLAEDLRELRDKDEE